MTAFPDGDEGGNPAGVVLDARGLDDAAMLAVAAEVGYSETAFVVDPAAGGDPRHLVVRYFSPDAEVPFCGHATIATAVAVAGRVGSGGLRFDTPAGTVHIATSEQDGAVVAAFTSVPTQVRELDAPVRDELLGLIGLTGADLAVGRPLLEAFAGNWHPVVVVADPARFDGFGFDPAAVRRLMDERGWTGTVTVVHERGDDVVEARNIFPVGAITEDPATGSAAASLGATCGTSARWPRRCGSPCTRAGTWAGRACWWSTSPSRAGSRSAGRRRWPPVSGTPGVDVPDHRGRTGLHLTGRDLDRNPEVVVRDVELLCAGWHVLRKSTFDHRRADGTWSTQQRETYDRGDGAAVLPYDVERGTVLLTRQFRWPVYVNGHPDGLLVEAAAGLLDDDAVAAIRREAAEELGVELRDVELVMAPWMSPGSVTERLHLFAAAWCPLPVTVAPGRGSSLTVACPCNPPRPRRTTRDPGGR